MKDTLKSEVTRAKRDINEVIEHCALAEKDARGLIAIKPVKQTRVKYSLASEIIKECHDYLESASFSNWQENMSVGQQRALAQLRKNYNLVIKPTDKNLGVSVVAIDAYLALANEHLADRATYKLLDKDPLDATTRQVKALLSDLVDKGEITCAQHNTMLPPTKPRIGYFYALTKLHKSKLGIRPIVSHIDHPTRNISKFLDQELKHLAVGAKSYCKNSTTLKAELESLRLEPTKRYKMFTADITSLYTNIPTNDGIQRVNQLYQANQLARRMLSKHALTSLLYNTLIGNVFSFDQSFYRQVTGTAMGTVMAPTYANAYLREREESSEPLNHPSLVLMRRYIDDILVLYDDSNSDFDEFCDQFRAIYKPLELTIETSDKSVDFLDMTITINKLIGRIETSLYRKPMNNKQLIPASSNHPRHTLENVVRGELQRTTSLCTTEPQKRRQRANILNRALRAGFSKRLVHAPPRERRPRPASDLPRVVLTHNALSNAISSIIKERWREARASTTTVNDVPPISVCYRNQPSLMRTLVNCRVRRARASH